MCRNYTETKTIIRKVIYTEDSNGREHSKCNRKGGQNSTANLL